MSCVLSGGCQSNLDDLTLRDVCHQDWCSILKDHGLDAEAEAFDAAMGDNLSASGARSPKNKRSASVQGFNYMPSASEHGSTYLLPTRIRMDRSQQAKSAVDDDDEDGSDASTVRGSVKSAYSSSAASVEAKPVKSKFNSSGVPVYPKHSVAWEVMQGNMRPSIVDHIRAESYPPRPSWMGPDLNFQGASSTKTGRQSTRRVISDSNAGASCSKEAATLSQQALGGIGSAHISKEPATPEKRNKAGTETPCDNIVEETEDSGERTTPTQVSYKQAELAKSSLVSATPQRHLLKSVDSVAVKNDLAHDNKTKVSTANTSNAMYIVKEMTAQESAHLDSWVTVHKEYHGWYRPLIIDHNIKLTLKNDQRKAFLEELANAEREGRPAFGNELSGSEREAVCKDVCPSMWSDIKTIRRAVNTGWVKRNAVQKAVKKAKEAAKDEGRSPPEAADLPPMPIGRTLGQVIDLMEGDEGFEDAVDKDGDSVM
jgi:hypothetical protein